MTDVGDTIGRYHVTGVLGAGTFATVYRASDEALDVNVAIKVLGENWAYDPDVRRRFINEAQLLRRAHGGHVVRVHDIGETESGQPYFVMDDADRGTVEDRLRELEHAGTPLSAEDVRRLVELLADGVEEVHRLGVVHRDLKPSNLLLRSGAPSLTAPTVGTAIVRPDEMLLVADLGFARDIDGPTRLTAAVGTEGYMAPEQRDVGGTIDERADVYACTAIVQRVVTGAPPPMTPGTPPDDVPKPIHDLFAFGLAAAARDRFRSIGAWRAASVAALGAAGQGLVIDADRAPAPAALASLSRASDTWTVDPETGELQPRRRRGLLVGIAAAVAVLLVIGAVVLVTRGGDEGAAPNDQPTTDGPPGVAPVPLDEARILDPIDVAVDSAGRVYVAELSTSRVRRIDGDEVVTIAGTGAVGNAGDGGQATDAELASPTGISVAADGTVLVANAFSGAVRTIAPDGTIETIAGGGDGALAVGEPAADAPISALDAVSANDGVVYITDNVNHVLWKVADDGALEIAAGTGEAGYDGDGGPATDAMLDSPSSVILADDGKTYVSDPGADVVRVIAPDGTISTVAGDGTEGFSGDDGPADEAQLDGPDGIALADDGTLYIADAGNRRIRRVAKDGTITTIAGDKTPLANPSGLALLDDGTLLIADGSENRVRALAPDGALTDYAGTGPAGVAGDNGPAVSAVVRAPESLSFDSAGNLYIAESYTGWVRRVTPDGTITTVAGGGSAPAPNGGAAVTSSLEIPTGLAVDANDDVYVGELAGAEVRAFRVGSSIFTIAGTGSAGYSGDGGPATQAQINTPYGLAFMPDGSLLIADGGSLHVRRVAPDGTISTFAGTGLPSQGDTDGPATSVGLDLPVAVAVATDGTAYISERTGNRIRKVAPDGTASVFAGTGTAGFSGDGGPAARARITDPAGLAVMADGSVVFAERTGQRVRKVAPDGTITTIAGTGVAGFSGDGGPAVDAQFDTPASVAVGADGAIYVADSGNNRVRRIARDGTITTVAGDI